MNYLWASLGSLVLMGISWAMGFVFNPLTLFFVSCASQLVRPFGKAPPAMGFSSSDAMMWTSVFWPLTLVPLHFLNYQILKWNHWAYAGLFAATGIFIAFVILMATTPNSA